MLQVGFWGSGQGSGAVEKTPGKIDLMDVGLGLGTGQRYCSLKFEAARFRGSGLRIWVSRFSIYRA